MPDRLRDCRVCESAESVEADHSMGAIAGSLMLV
ncbi:MAG: hypothetical protein JWO33_446, partial [Caulobacteraceae bacterium]|nr:hypothetical protein [Caulobacteraceae bacterium]